MGALPHANGDRGPHVVLAVDDEPANQRAVRRALGDECQVLTAGSGAEGLAVMAREPVALVIADQRMPGMSGVEFLAETVQRHPDVIRVVLTGYTDVETLVDAINAGHVYHFLGKPWEARELRQVVRRGLERFAADAERRRLVEALRAACARAERDAAQKSRLLLMTAHELGTPLHILLNSLEILMADALPPAARCWAETAERAAAWLARGVGQMHTAARARDQRRWLRCERVAVDALLKEVVRDLRVAAAGRDLAIDLAVAGPLPPVDGDRQWIRQAVADLLTNAVRFTPDGGWVRVESGAEEGWLTVAVADSGIGIPPEHLEDVFEPFSAAGGDPLRHGSGGLAFGARGLGLGLATVKGIIEAHGGRVSVDSTPGVGSRFVLRLPVARPAGGASGPSPA